jgi:hypothetical protein
MFSTRRFRNLALFAVLTNSLAALAFMSACGDDDKTTPNVTDTDGGTGTPEASPPVVVTNDKESKQVGKVVRAQSEDERVPGVTVKVGSNTAVTGATGEYEVLVPRNTPYSPTFAAPDFYTLLEQELIVKNPVFQRGGSTLLPRETADFLAGLLPGRNKEKGFLVVKVNPLPPCDTEEGSTLTIDPPGEAKISYFSGALPASSQTSVKGGTTFSAAFYNIEPNVQVTVTVNSPKCKQVAFPIDIPVNDDPANVVTYTGKQTTQPGESLAYLRVYIKDPLSGSGDAGNDQ